MKMEKSIRNNYHTDSETRKEFESFLSWYIDNKLDCDSKKLSISTIIEEYFKSNNIALYGIKKIQGAYTRNAKKELFIIICIPIVSLIISLILFGLCVKFKLIL